MGLAGAILNALMTSSHIPDYVSGSVHGNKIYLVKDASGIEIPGVDRINEVIVAALEEKGMSGDEAESMGYTMPTRVRSENELYALRERVSNFLSGNGPFKYHIDTSDELRVEVLMQLETFSYREVCLLELMLDRVHENLGEAQIETIREYENTPPIEAIIIEDQDTGRDLYSRDMGLGDYERDSADNANPLFN